MSKSFAVYIILLLACGCRQNQQPSPALTARPAVMGIETPDLEHLRMDATLFTIPKTSLVLPEDINTRAHTNYIILNDPKLMQRWHVTPAAVPVGVSPEQLKIIYGVDPSSKGSGAIAVVDAFDYPTALADFNTYSQADDLPSEPSIDPASMTNNVLTVVYADGNKPSPHPGWNGEEALDIEIAHAIAPSAKIFLVEAHDDSLAALMDAVKTAASLPGVAQVSMSWTYNEFSGENKYDSWFSGTGIVFFAATGDIGNVACYPATSPNVVGVGGTTLHFDQNGKFSSESGWTNGGGGTSLYEPRPNFQQRITVSGTARATPDIAADADQFTGVGVFVAGSWKVMGGTSLSCPICAALTNDAGSHCASSAAELTKIYTAPATAFHDIVIGNNGKPCGPGYDLVTGIGTPNGPSGL